MAFELLYWLPLLNWLTGVAGVDRERVVAVSRGGVEGWYGDVAGTYRDVEDPEELSSGSADLTPALMAGAVCAVLALRLAGAAAPTCRAPAAARRRRDGAGSLALRAPRRLLRRELPGRAAGARVPGASRRPVGRTGQLALLDPPGRSRPPRRRRLRALPDARRPRAGRAWGRGGACAVRRRRRDRPDGARPPTLVFYSRGGFNVPHVHLLARVARRLAGDDTPLLRTRHIDAVDSVLAPRASRHARAVRDAAPRVRAELRPRPRRAGLARPRCPRRFRGAGHTLARGRPAPAAARPAREALERHDRRHVGRTRRSLVARGLRISRDYLRYLDDAYRDAPRLRERAGRRVPRAVKSFPGVRFAPVRRALAGRARLGGAACAGEPRGRALPPRAAPRRQCSSPRCSRWGRRRSSYVREAKRLGVPTALAVASWDNLTNKGVLHELPDAVIVWNDAQREEAVRLLDVPGERVVVTGAQCYDHWFGQRPAPRSDEFCRRVGLDPGTRSSSTSARRRSSRPTRSRSSGAGWRRFGPRRRRSGTSASSCDRILRTPRSGPAWSWTARSCGRGGRRSGRRRRPCELLRLDGARRGGGRCQHQRDDRGRRRRAAGAFGARGRVRRVAAWNAALRAHRRRGRDGPRRARPRRARRAARRRDRGAVSTTSGAPRSCAGSCAPTASTLRRHRSSPTRSRCWPMSDPTVVVGVPMYGREQWLREALDSLLAQTYRAQRSSSSTTARRTARSRLRASSRAVTSAWSRFATTSDSASSARGGGIRSRARAPPGRALLRLGQRPRPLGAGVARGARRGARLDPDAVLAYPFTVRLDAGGKSCTSRAGSTPAASARRGAG